MLVYHATPRRNLETILRDGLKQDGTDRTCITKRGIYFCPDRDKALWMSRVLIKDRFWDKSWPMELDSWREDRKAMLAYAQEQDALDLQFALLSVEVPDQLLFTDPCSKLFGGVKMRKGTVPPEWIVYYDLFRLMPVENMTLTIQ